MELGHPVRDLKSPSGELHRGLLSLGCNLSLTRNASPTLLGSVCVGVCHCAYGGEPKACA